MKSKIPGFTLIELMVVIAIIGLLASILFASFDQSRQQSRDKVRMAILKELQLALELYRAQHHRYPEACNSSPVSAFAGPGFTGGDPGLHDCMNYIEGASGRPFTPDFISSLPRDPNRELEPGLGIYYRTDAIGSAFKLMFLNSVEALPVAPGDEFARCPTVTGACASGIPTHTYAVYSAGAENW